MTKTPSSESLLAVAPGHRIFMEKLSNKLLKQGYELIIREIRGGYTATYQLEKKTVMNWVFRKTGIWARIYGDNAGRYKEVIVALPVHMQEKTATFRNCKRLIGPNAYNDTRVKGLVYSLNREIQKRYRNDGMLFLLIEETAEYIAGLICTEATAREPALQQLGR